MNDLSRYGRINEKNRREIVLLRGRGCKWRTCLFCDYHKDGSENESDNYRINKAALSRVEGMYGVLEVVNSGSFSDLDKETIEEIVKVCEQKEIKTLHIESHWLDRELALEFKKLFEKNKITVKMKIGVETFDDEFRRKVLNKHINANVEEIARFFDECCLLVGISGQDESAMKSDIETGLQYFERVCVNVMQNNSAVLRADKYVIKVFREKIYPVYRKDERIDILVNNTDFGVGRLQNAK